jgi:hypothetical protein
MSIVKLYRCTKVKGIYEEALGHATRKQYVFNGAVVAQRTIGGGSDSLAYLHSDHLGSLSASTDTNGNTLFTQDYTPWGDARRNVGINAHTSLNYTGQRRDGTGLL